MTEDVDFDATGISIELDKMSGPELLMKLWRLRIQSKENTAIFLLDAIHFSDILGDSGIDEPGDVSNLKTRISFWRPEKPYTGAQRLFRAEEIYINEGDKDGPEAILSISVEDDGALIDYNISLSGQIWKELLLEVQKEVSTPWFSHIQEGNLKDNSLFKSDLDLS
jgi:hypothetical protein